MKKSQRKMTVTEALAKVANLPRTEVAQTAPRESLASWTRGYDAEEKRKQEEAEQAKFAGVRAAENQLNETMRQLRDQQAAALFQSESVELNSKCPLIKDGDFTEKDSVESIRVRVRAAFDAARLAIEETDGVRLEASALSKCQTVSRKNLQVKWTEAEAWGSLIRHMLDLGVFTSHDVTYLRVTAPVAQEQPTVDLLAAIEALPATREGERKARELANASYWTTEAADMYAKWAQSIYDAWSVTLTEKQKQAVIQYFLDTNKSFLRYESWNEARRYLVKVGVLESCMVTEDEVLAGRLENTNLNDRDARIAFARESRRING
jgi:hypothetical protein